MKHTLLLLAFAIATVTGLAEDKPKITKPILFNTPEADAIVSKMQIFPKDSPWNEDISKLPIRANSKKIIANIGPEKRLAYNNDMNYVIVPPDQKKIDLKIVAYPDESDKGPFPIPDNAPIEGWPMDKRTLKESQEGKEQADRHMIVVDPTNNRIHEFFVARKLPTGWQADCVATFDLSSNKMRPDTWTSSDAAGLPIFPSIVRYDEVAAGKVNHALRFTITKTQRAYVYPATHYASPHKDPDLARMGERFRLRADFDDSKFHPHAKAIVHALKTYGMFVADNGGDWRISVAPDDRIKGLDDIRKILGKDFEVVQTTGPDEGPRKKK